MPQFITRLFADSLVRLSKRAYRVESEVTSFVFPFPQGRVAVVDRFMPLGEEWVPNGIAIQVESEATDITAAIEESGARALPVLSLLSLTVGGAVGLPIPIWSYEVTPNVADRAWRYLAYDHRLGIQSRPAQQAELAEIWAKIDKFTNRTDISLDYKLRLFAGIHSYRRALADNDDVLSEFLALWPSFESLNCVHEKLYPAPKSEKQAGMTKVFDQLEQPQLFDDLRKVRNGIAHGSMNFKDAIEKATANIDLVRKALKLMVLRLIDCDEAISQAILDRPAMKGVYPPHLRIVGTIRTEPVNVSDFTNQPHVEPDYQGEVKTVRDGDKLTISPAMNFRLHKPGAVLEVTGYEVWGEKSTPLVFSTATAEVIRGVP